MEESGIRAYLGLHEAGGRGSDFFPKSAFAYDAGKDLYICPAGETVRALGDAEDRRSRGMVVTYRARGSVCAACSLKPRCTTNKNGRSLRRGPGEKYIDLLRAYMQTEPYRKAIRKRKVWIEPLFAEGKLWHGMRRFRTRTLEKVNTEALMTATGQNIKRLLAFGGSAPKRLAQAAALRPPGRLLPDSARRRFRDHRHRWRIDPTLFNRLGHFCYILPLIRPGSPGVWKLSEKSLEDPYMVVFGGAKRPDKPPSSRFLRLAGHQFRAHQDFSDSLSTSFGE